MLYITTKGRLLLVDRYCRRRALEYRNYLVFVSFVTLHMASLVDWLLPLLIPVIHVRLEFDHEKLHDLQMPIICGDVEWCLTGIILGIHVRLEFDHEKLHDLQIPIKCGSV